MQFLVVLFVAALWVKYFWVFVALVVAIWLGRKIYEAYGVARSEAQARADAEAERLDGLRRRADQQHNWRMQGDPRGTYGESAAT